MCFKGFCHRYAVNQIGCAADTLQNQMIAMVNLHDIEYNIDEKNRINIGQNIIQCRKPGNIA